MEFKKVNEAINQIQEAIDLIYQARDIVDEALSDFEERRFVQNYIVYGKYGFNQLIGEGNPYDSSLETLIEELEKEKENG